MGGILIDSQGIFTFSGNLAIGNYSFDYDVTDPGSGLASPAARVFLGVTNVPPDPGELRAHVVPHEQYDFGPELPDLDGEGETIVYAPVANEFGTLISVPGGLSYISDSEFVGVTRFTYSASDGFDTRTNGGTITVSPSRLYYIQPDLTVTNGAPPSMDLEAVITTNYTYTLQSSPALHSESEWTDSAPLAVPAGTNSVYVLGISIPIDLSLPQEYFRILAGPPTNPAGNILRNAGNSRVRISIRNAR